MSSLILGKRWPGSPSTSCGACSARAVPGSIATCLRAVWSTSCRRRSRPSWWEGAASIDQRSCHRAGSRLRTGTQLVCRRWRPVHAVSPASDLAWSRPAEGATDAHSESDTRAAQCGRPDGTIWWRHPSPGSRRRSSHRLDHRVGALVSPCHCELIISSCSILRSLRTFRRTACKAP